ARSEEHEAGDRDRIVEGAALGRPARHAEDGLEEDAEAGEARHGESQARDEAEHHALACGPRRAEAPAAPRRIDARALTPGAHRSAAPSSRGAQRVGEARGTHTCPRERVTRNA